MNNAKYGGTSLLPELKVIPEGLLKGFVIVHPKWGSFTQEDYLNACKSVDPEEPKEVTEFAAKEGEFDLREYEVVDFKLFDDQNVPAVVLSGRKVKFSQSCIRRMKCGNYVELLVHPVKKQLAIRQADKDDRYAIQWASGEKENQTNRGVACKAFIGTLYGIFGWKEDRKYKLYGRVYHDGKASAAVFTEIGASVYIRKEEYFSESGTEAAGQIASSGKCIRAVTGDLGHNFGTDYYVEKSRRELTELTKEQWLTRIEGQMCAPKDKLNITSYDTLREFIKEQLGDLFEEADEE